MRNNKGPMKNKFILLVAIIISLGSICIGVYNYSDVVVKKNSPPQLWSDHKRLDIPADVCALKGYSALKSLGFTNVVKNGNYSYGNFNDNRAAVKCVEMNGGSFVYMAVAGPKNEVVEKLRNEIAWKF